MKLKNIILPKKQPTVTLADIGFICGALGMVPIAGRMINPHAIAYVEPSDGGANLVMANDEEIAVSHEQLAELEGMIRAQITAAQQAAQSGKILIPHLVKKGQ